MGWTKWTHYEEDKMCPKCGYCKGLLRRKYRLLGKVIRTQTHCEDCKLIKLGKKKKRSPTSLRQRKTQLENPKQKGKPKSTQRLISEVNNKNVKNFKLKKPKKRTNINVNKMHTIHGKKKLYTSKLYHKDRAERLNAIPAAELETLRQRIAIKKLKSRYARNRKEQNDRHKFLEESNEK